MAQVKFKRGNKQFIDNLPIVDGQLIYNTNAGDYYMDSNGKRISSKDYVTPEMFGAVGDGVADDSEAMEKALKVGKQILGNGVYRLAKTIYPDKFFTISNCNFLIDSKSSISSAFCLNDNIDGIFTNCKFKSTLDQIGVAPQDHTRQDYTTSNIIAIFLTGNHEDLLVEKCTFQNMEMDIKTTEATVKNIISTNCTTENSSCHIYASNVKKVVSKNFNGKMRENLGSGDHCFYLEYGVKEVLIEDAEIYTDNFSGSGMHFYAGGSLYENTMCNIINVKYNGEKFLDWWNAGKAIIFNCDITVNCLLDESVPSGNNGSIQFLSCRIETNKDSSSNYILGVANLKFNNCDIKAKKSLIFEQKIPLTDNFELLIDSCRVHINDVFTFKDFDSIKIINSYIISEVKDNGLFDCLGRANKILFRNNIFATPNYDYALIFEREASAKITSIGNTMSQQIISRNPEKVTSLRDDLEVSVNALV